MNNMVYYSFVSIHYYICECGDTFPTEEALKVHLENEHQNKDEKEETEYQCSMCNKVFATEKACLIHQHLEKRRMRRHPEDVATIKKKYYNTKNIICEVCGKRYASNAALRYHQRVHTGERPYQCSLCPKSFTMPLFLQIHTRTHTGERPYECKLCPKAFSNKAALLRHDRVHTGIKPYECPQCGKFFTQSNSMKLHVKTVHLKMPAPYKSKNRRAKQAIRQAAIASAMETVDVPVEYDKDINTQIKSEMPEYETDEQVYEGDEIYHEVYEDSEGLFEVKVEASEVPIYDHDHEQPEVLYEEVYEMEEGVDVSS